MRGSWRLRPSTALSLLQVGEAIPEEGEAGAERDRRGRWGFIHSFSGISWNAAQQNTAALRGAGQSNGHMEKARGPPTSASVWGRSFRQGAVGAGLRRKSHVFRQN